MMLEFLHHRHPEDWLVGGVDEHVNPDQSGEEIPLVTFHSASILFLLNLLARYRNPI